ncbi:MAG TPA: DUF1223 domain-containing protein [Chthoniobacterales bacterium]|nr:DUF1223 domain-containing protein [Chthoniobacterales bacterium]
MKVFGLLAVLLCVSGMSGRAAIRLESGAQQVGLLELYTSEGCSSCPPAEAWISRRYGGLIEQRSIVPVTFHVDYWDQLGWKDRFAKVEFTARQRLYSASWGRGSVYTPCFVFNGQEWGGWFRGETPAGGRSIDVGNLEALIDGDKVEVRFTPIARSKEYVAFVAPLAMQANSDVRAGENQGHRLNHDFVALSLASSKMESRDALFRAVLQVSMDGARAMAVWVTLDHSLVPVQAVGGRLE